MSLAELEKEIEDYLAQGVDLSQFIENHPTDGAISSIIWVIKYIPSVYLPDFLQLPQVRISSRPGFTWGDAIYVAPLQCPYSSMIYGRAGIVGYINQSHLRVVFDANQPQAIRLYQRWIQTQSHNYNMLTSTVHANVANRELRNDFRRRFKIDIVVCRPDQYSRYTNLNADRWFAISDWNNLDAKTCTSYARGYTDLVRDCKWVAIVGEDFQAETPPIRYRDLFGQIPHTCNVVFVPPPRGSSLTLQSCLRNQHSSTPGIVGQHKVILIGTDS